MIKGENEYLSHTEEREQEKEPLLVSRFDSIKNKPDLAPSLDQFGSIFEDQSFREHSFEEVRRAFLFVYDNEKIIASLDSANKTKQDFLYLKKVRRFGLILKAQYQFLSSSHLSPERFHQFFSLLGKANDCFWLEEKNEFREKLLHLSSSFQISDLTIDFADSKSFKIYATETINQIDDLIMRDELTAKDFHMLRKKIRLCADLLQNSATKDFGGNIHWLFASVLSL